MKIIFVVDSLANSGTEKSLLDILSNFSETTQAILVYLHPPHSLRNKFEKVAIKTICLNENINKGFITNFFLLNEIIRKEKPDFVVSSLYKSNILSRFSCLLTKTRLIGTFVSDSYSELRFKNYSLKQKVSSIILKQFDKLTATIPIGFISNSYSIKVSNCKRLAIQENRVKVIYRGRNIEQILEWNQPLNNSKFTFIIISRVLETKGFRELITAFSILVKTYPNIVLEIYGDGTFLDFTKKMLAQPNLSNSIILKGNQLDAWKNLYNANCFIFPSWYEGLSGALIEATISGIPTIASNIPMNIEVIQNCRTTITHQVKDVNDIVNAMKKMILNYKEFVAHTAGTREIAIGRFDVKKIAAAYEEYFMELSLKK